MAEPTYGERCRELLLDHMRREGGEWTGLRAARCINAHREMQITRHRGDEHLLKLMEAGHLVQTRPPRGRTFVLAPKEKADDV